MLIDGGIGFGYILGRKWCKLCHLWYPDEAGKYCPVHHKRFRLRPRATKDRKKMALPRG
jgi:hypothetical protein